MCINKTLNAGQLLGLTIEREQPELEQQKSALLRQEEELKMQLADLEKSLLQTLANSTGESPVDTKQIFIVHYSQAFFLGSVEFAEIGNYLPMLTMVMYIGGVCCAHG